MTKEMAINILRGAVFETDEQTHEAVYMAIRTLKEQERVDAVEVVRCKNCAYWDATEKVCVDMMTADENGYCAWGERREDET